MAAVQTELIDSAAAEAFIQLAKTTDKFERYENPHAQRIAVIADEIAQQFQLARHDRGSLYAAALLHDLGEVAMERDYIQATGPLSTEERLDLSRHPVLGEREASRVGADRAAQLLVRWHHEWWNGSGYPDALRQTEIPLAARILRIADSYSALTDARPFRAAMSEEVARHMIIEGAGIEFDPMVVSVFLSLERFDELKSFARRADEPSDELFHRARKASKRHRYAVEAALPVWGGKADKIISQRKDLQDLLGNHQAVVRKCHHRIEPFPRRLQVSARNVVFAALAGKQRPKPPHTGAAVVVATVRPLAISVVVIAIPPGAPRSFHLD